MENVSVVSSAAGLARRVSISQDPFEEPSANWQELGHWQARWISHRQPHDGRPCVVAYRLRFEAPAARAVRIHVTADERYELYLDGQRIGWGSERGNLDNWFFETYELNLPPGPHVLVARTWWLGADAPSAYAQMGVRPAFLLAAEGEDHAWLSTGSGQWQCRELRGYEFLWPQMAWGTGANVRIIGKDFDWGIEHGEGEGWQEPCPVARAAGAAAIRNHPAPWTLAPAALPAMRDQLVQVGVARHVEQVDDEQTRPRPVRSANHLPEAARQWTAMLSGGAALTIPPRTMRRAIIDLGDYYTAFPQLLLSGGRGARVRLHWAEALYEDLEKRDQGFRGRRKGNRDEIEGKCFWGIGDVFEPDGGPHRLFEPLWWQAGRYLECFVHTGDDPLTIERLSLRHTHYPFVWENRFESSDARLAGVIPIMRRALESCSHETYMDCPYYEQLMYVGDTRLEVLATYVSTRDDRLPRKAIRLFDASRLPGGLTQSRYPSRHPQVIPPFSLWWVAMVHDYALWRDDPEFVADRMPGVRAVLEGYRQFVNADGLLERPLGWNYMDWVPQWRDGVPPGEKTVSAMLNYQFGLVLRQAAELERWNDEPELAARHDRLADRLAAAADGVFWDDRRGLYADDAEHSSFSEHAQSLALLGELVPPARRGRVIQGLFDDQDLHRMTIYFSHYLFETCRLLHRMDQIWPRLQLWFDHPALGMKTTLEHPEPSRSDCHAWGAHPLFHYFASVLGIRPGGPGFRNVRVEPQLGPLTWAKGEMPHPRGVIRADLRQRDGRINGMIKLPEGVSGILVTADGERPLKAGEQQI